MGLFVSKAEKERRKQEEQERIEKQKKEEQERIEKQKKEEQERIEKQKKEEQERIEKQKKEEQERIEKQKKEEQERIEKRIAEEEERKLKAKTWYADHFETIVMNIVNNGQREILENTPDILKFKLSSKIDADLIKIRYPDVYLNPFCAVTYMYDKEGNFRFLGFEMPGGVGWETNTKYKEERGIKLLGTPHKECDIANFVFTKATAVAKEKNNALFESWKKENEKKKQKELKRKEESDKEFEDTIKTINTFLENGRYYIDIKNGFELYCVSGLMVSVGEPHDFFKDFNGKNVVYECTEISEKADDWKTREKTCKFSPERLTFKGWSDSEIKTALANRAKCDPIDACYRINLFCSKIVTGKVKETREQMLKDRENGLEWKRIEEERDKIKQVARAMETDITKFQNERVLAEQATIILEAKKEAIRKEEQRLRNERELLEATKDQRGGEFKEIPNCVICMDTKARYTIVPCGHLCLCAHCSKEAKNIKKCPMCNTPIEKIIKTYFV